MYKLGYDEGKLLYVNKTFSKLSFILLLSNIELFKNYSSLN